jgi:hypothetical protein
MSGGVNPLLSPPQIVSHHHSRARAKPQKAPALPRFCAQACVSVQFSAACPTSALLPRRLGARGRFVPAYGRKRGASLPLRAYSRGSERRTAPIFSWYMIKVNIVLLGIYDLHAAKLGWINI